MFPLNLYARVRFLFATFARETAGAARTRSSLRPLIFSGANEFAKLGQSMSRERGVMFGDRRWGNGPRSAFQASRARYGAVGGALRAACLEGGRSSLTLMV
jgi:hypothetical protein